VHLRDCIRVAEKNGHAINHLEIYAIVLDLKKHEATYKAELPNKPVVKFILNRWDNQTIEDYIKERISLLIKAETLTDEELSKEIPCTRYEQWSEKKDTSIFKKGATRATKVFETREEAEQFLADHPTFTADTHEIRDRYTARTRCLNYCECKNICLQFKRELEEENEGKRTLLF
jgi:hypothetical protein